MTGRYITFSGDNHYPYGGWADFRGNAPTLEGAKELADKQWAHVVDLESGNIVTERTNYTDWRDL